MAGAESCVAVGAAGRALVPISLDSDPRTWICPLCNGLGLVSRRSATIIDRLRLSVADLLKKCDAASSSFEAIKSKRTKTIEEARLIASRAGNRVVSGNAVLPHAPLGEKGDMER